ncbi:AraC family transcriptional regulator [Clostridium sp. D53t1_180928_C8]|uniref:AraC family transcriptional regulator n=1 Tax=Clostridium sp. D53t1_180928_C8 TaxID=2787101 RepID=UPI0018AB8F69|nr:AraC family transcriptional regulator [Clostridium sp. D53t1_180928_C8]
MKYFDFKEEKEHGTFDFPIEFYHVTQDHPRYNMDLHWHTQCEIIRVLEGEFSLILDDEKILSKAGDILFIHDGVVHGGTPVNCVYECIVFDMNLLLKKNITCTKLLSDIINHNKIIDAIISGHNEHIDIWCNYLFEAINSKEPGFELIVQGSLYALLGMILRSGLYKTKSSSTKRTNTSLQQLKTVLTLLEEKFSEPLTLEDLSKSVGMTPKYFCRFFHQMTNKTPIEYLNYYRIDVACELMLTKDICITDVALDCGFNDVSYFIKTFKKYKGITPKQYIKTFLSKSI